MIKLPCFFSKLEPKRDPAQQVPKTTSTHNAFCIYEKGKDHFTVQNNTEISFEIPLLSKIRQIFSLPEGLIIEVENEEEINFGLLKDKIGNKEESCPGQDRNFSYFSLSDHPLSDFRPVCRKKEYKMYKDQFQILKTDINLPFAICYDHEKQKNVICVLQYNFKQIFDQDEKVDFDSMIQILQQKNTGFDDKVLARENFINFDVIHECSGSQTPASQIEIVESCLNNTKPYEKQFFLYLLIENSLKVFEMNFFLKQDYKGRFRLKSEVSQVSALQGISEIRGLNFFSQRNPIFKVKDYFKDNINSKEKLVSYIHLVEGNNEQISLNMNKFEKQFFNFQNKIACKEFLTSVNPNNALLIRQGEQLLLLAEQTILFEVRLPDAVYLNSAEKFFAEFSISQISNLTITFLNRKTEEERLVEIPTFSSEFFDLIFEVAKEIFDRQTFWFLVKSLFRNNSSIKSQKTRNFSTIVNSEEELLTGFFSSLLVIQKLNKLDQRDLLKKNDFFQKNFSFSQNKDHVDEDEDYFDSIYQMYQGDLDFQEIIDAVNIKYLNHDKASSYKLKLNNSNGQFMPEILINLEVFHESKIKFFKYLHLCNEDLRLSKNSVLLHQNLTHFLFCYSSFLDEPSSLKYADYYLKIYPAVLTRTQQSKFLYGLNELSSSLTTKEQRCQKSSLNLPSQSQEYFNEELDGSQIFNIFLFLSDFFNGKVTERQLKNTPLFFTNTYNLFKMLSMILKVSFKNKKFKPAHIQLPKQQMGPRGEKLLILNKQFFISFNKQTFLETKKRELIIRKNKRTDGNFKLFDKVFNFFIKNEISINYIEGLEDCIEYIYKIFIRLTRQKISFYSKNPFLPLTAYELLNREDIFLNKLISPNQNSFRYLSHRKSNNSMLSAHNKSQSFFLHPDESMLNKSNRRGDSFLNHTMTKNDEQQRELKTTLKGAMVAFDNVLKQNFNDNLHYQKNDPLFQQLYNFYDCSEVIQLSAEKANIILEDNELNGDEITFQLQQLLEIPMIKRLAGFVGRGALDFNSEETSFTTEIQIPHVNFSGQVRGKPMPIKYILNPEQPEDMSEINWAIFHNGVAAGLKIKKHELEGYNKEDMRTWIDFQKKELNQFDHAGLLFALGLQGHLNCFTISDIYFNLRACNDSRIIATILGLAVSKMPRNRIHMEETVIKAFNLHLEFYYQANADVQISKIVQSAAMVGLGIYLQGMAKKSKSESMLAQIQAKPFNENNKGRFCYSLSAGFSLGLINLGKGSDLPSIRDMKIDEKLFQYIEGRSISKTNSDYKSCNIKEIDQVNTYLTAPSALIALTLIHLKLNNKIITDRLSIPNTIHQINQCNAFVVLLKVIARNLINWDQIENTNEFLNRNIPSTVKFIAEKNISDIREKFQQNYNFTRLDYHQHSLVYHNIICGTLLSMAFKYAGSGNQALKNLIVDNIKKFSKIQTIKKHFCSDRTVQMKLDAYSLYNLLSVLSLALSIVMAGYCDTESLKIVQKLRRKMSADIVNGKYGFNMAFEMAIGFLFLGNGSYTFGNEDFQLACLLLAVYPIFPKDYNDNSQHLQAYRHFYVAATEPNLFNLIDIDTQAPLKLRVELSFFDERGRKHIQKKVTPLYYKENHVWDRLRVLDDDYHEMDFQFLRNEQKPRFLFVKTKFTHQINLKNLKRELLLQGRGSIDQLLKPNLMKDLFLSSFYEKNHYQNKSYFKGFLYSMMRKDQSSIIDLACTYFLNGDESNERQLKVQSMNYQQKRKFQLNGEIMINFHKKILKGKDKFGKSTVDYFSRNWDITREIYFLQKTIDGLYPDLGSLQLFFKFYLDNDINSIIKKSNFESSDQFEIFSNFLWSLHCSNVSTEHLRQIMHVLRNQNLKHTEQILKHLLKAAGIKLNPRMFQILCKLQNYWN